MNTLDTSSFIAKISVMRPHLQLVTYSCPVITWPQERDARNDMMSDVEETGTQAIQTKPQPMDAPQLESALAHLDRLQRQVRNLSCFVDLIISLTIWQLDTLRTTLPSLVAPLARPATSKAQMFAGVRKAAVQSTSDLNRFREEWTSEQTQGLLARGRESLGEVREDAAPSKT